MDPELKLWAIFKRADEHPPAIPSEIAQPFRAGMTCPAQNQVPEGRKEIHHTRRAGAFLPSLRDSGGFVCAVNPELKLWAISFVFTQSLHLG